MFLYINSDQRKLNGAPEDGYHSATSLDLKEESSCPQQVLG
jgi:hypothetical protein